MSKQRTNKANVALRQWWQGVVESIARRRRLNKAVAELERLDPRLRRDIGADLAGLRRAARSRRKATEPARGLEANKKLLPDSRRLPALPGTARGCQATR